MLPRHGRPTNPGPDDFEWPDGRWTIGPAPVPDDGPDRWTPPADDDGRWVLTTPDDGPGPSVEDRPGPDPLDECEWMGMSLRLSGEPMAELVGSNSTASLLRFAVGQVLGLEARIDRDRRRDDGPRETDGYAPGYCS